MAGYYGWAEFDFDEERDLREHKVWVIDAKDCVPPVPPFEVYIHMVAGHFATQYGSDMICNPMAMLEFRFNDGFEYATATELSEEERKRRELLFRERIAPWIEDFERQWRGKYVPELEEGFQSLKKVDLEKLSDIELRVHFEDWLSYMTKNWYIHMINHYAAYHIYGLFEDICKELFGIDEHHPQFKALMSGFDNRIFQVHRGLWQLGRMATELGLGSLFQTIGDDEKLLSELEGSEAGRKWLERLHEFLDENGWRTPRTFTVSGPSWIEKPRLALPDIRAAIAMGSAFLLDEERARLAQKREEVEKDLLSRVSVEKREMFEKLMRAAQWAGRYSEEHIFWCEHYANSLGRRVLKEIGTRFAREGVIDDPQDICLLLPDEIRLRMGPMGRYDAHQLTRMRKEQYEGFLKAQPSFFIGDPSALPEVISSEVILLRVVAGVPVVKPELKADLYGSNSAPGLAEGPARVIFSEDEFSLVQAGEVLVTVTTGPVWTPLFGIVKGVVTDTGGGLTHAIIVGREYGLPVVAGTMEGTQKIKTGQRIRVDGDNCCVYILS